MSGSATLTIELSMTCIRAASTTSKAMRYLCGAPSGGAAIGSVSGSSSVTSGATALATDIACSQCKVHPVGKLGILLSRIDSYPSGSGRISNPHRFPDRLRARNLRAGENAVFLALRSSAVRLLDVLLAATEHEQRENGAEQSSTFGHS